MADRTARPRATGRPTITDVARLADVASITVSRALRDPQKVSEALRNRIFSAIQQIGYSPDPQAQILASGRSNAIAVILPSLTNSVFADVLRGIYDQTAGTPYQIVIGNTRYDPAEEERLVNLLLSQRPAAMLLTGIDQNTACQQRLRQAHCPIIQIMDWAETPFDMQVGVDHHAAGALAAQHLIDAGYRKIGFIGASMDHRVLRRRNGFCQHLAAQGLWNSQLEQTSAQASSVPLGRLLFRALHQQQPTIDAVFCVNDDLALGALFECQDQGIAIPDAMGIIGFNDLDIMGAAVPSLSSVAIDRYGMGRKATAMLMARLSGKPPAKPSINLGFHIAGRASTRQQTSA